MDTLFHLSMTLFAAVLLGFHKKYGWKVVLSLALMAILIDVDHFMIKDFKPLHNVFFVIALPLILFAVFYKLKNEKWQKFSLLAMLVLASHLVADYFYAPVQGVPFFYPLTWKVFAFPQWTWTIQQGNILTPESLAFLVAFSVLMLTYFIDKFLSKLSSKRLAPTN